MSCILLQTVFLNWLKEFQCACFNLFLTELHLTFILLFSYYLCCTSKWQQTPPHVSRVPWLHSAPPGGGPPPTLRNAGLNSYQNLLKIMTCVIFFYYLRKQTTSPNHHDDQQEDLGKKKKKIFFVHVFFTIYNSGLSLNSLQTRKVFLFLLLVSVPVCVVCSLLRSNSSGKQPSLMPLGASKPQRCCVVLG